jgi:hypothetical protein
VLAVSPAAAGLGLGDRTGEGEGEVAAALLELCEAAIQSLPWALISVLDTEGIANVKMRLVRGGGGDDDGDGDDDEDGAEAVIR